MSRTNFGAEFLKSIDTYLAADFQTMTCAELAAPFWDMYEAMKQETGTAAGIHGLSEFLPFRFLYHALGGKFERANREGSKKGCLEFHSLEGPALVLSRGRRFETASQVVTPDTAVCVEGKLVAVFEVKVYPEGGARGMKETTDKLAALRRSRWSSSDMKACVIVHDARETYPGVAQMLDVESRRRPWLNVVWLRNDTRPAVDVLVKDMLPASILDHAFRREP